MYKKGKNPFKELTPKKKKQLPKRKPKR